MHNHFISCDWGTSSFRLRLVDTASGHVLHEVVSSSGIAAIYQAYLQYATEKQSYQQERHIFYMQFVRDQLQILGRQSSFPIQGLPVIISGMASSSIGMLELPYASLPFSLNGLDTVVHKISAQADFPHDILLISGLKSTQDVMRGEETQIIGLAANSALGNAICIFPGTHSKHIFVADGCITGFRTYMTGELFQTLANHTILQASVEKSNTDENDPLMMKWYRQGVKAGIELGNILHALFTVRTGQLFKERTKQENYFYLSGLLIGYELKDLAKQPPASLYLCSSSHLLTYYQAAAEVLHLTGDLTVISGDLIDHTAVAGQRQLWYRHTSQTL